MVKDTGADNGGDDEVAGCRRRRRCGKRTQEMRFARPTANSPLLNRIER